MNVMEGKILGISLSVLGIVGLVLALVYMNAAAGPKDVNMLLGCGIFGAIIFFAGIRLLPARKVMNTSTENVNKYEQL